MAKANYLNQADLFVTFLNFVVMYIRKTENEGTSFRE